MFKSLIICGLCRRKMQGQHSHGVAYYRCRYPAEYALTNHVDHPRNVTLREELLIKPLDGWLTQQFAPQYRENTIAYLIHQASADCSPTAAGRYDVVEPAEAIIAECDAKLVRYRAALDAGADPAVVAGWIAQTQAERRRAEQAYQRTGASERDVIQQSEAELTAIIDQLGGLTTALQEADPAHKFEVYRHLGLQLIYDYKTKTVRAEINLSADRWDSVRVRGGC